MPAVLGKELPLLLGEGHEDQFPGTPESRTKKMQHPMSLHSSQGHPGTRLQNPFNIPLWQKKGTEAQKIASGNFAYGDLTDK